MNIFVVVGKINLAMRVQKKLILIFLMANLWQFPTTGFGQQIANVPEAFNALGTEPEIIFIKNNLDIPSENGHFQGVQYIEKNGSDKLLLSGSSSTEAYILQINLKKQKTDRVITLMKDPYRHAGGIQVSGPYMIVGIEDNIIKTTSKVCLYNYRNNKLYNSQANIIIERNGQAKQKTAGATGLLAMENDYLAVVANWDSRNWDFYQIDPKISEQKFLYSFAAPKDWGSYQSINFIKDGNAIYAIGFYKKDLSGQADLILVSKLGSFDLVMKKIQSKTFKCTNGVDFNSAVGLQVDSQGKLNIWSTQANPGKQIAVNKFAQK